MLHFHLYFIHKMYLLWDRGCNFFKEKVIVLWVQFDFFFKERKWVYIRQLFQNNPVLWSSLPLKNLFKGLQCLLINFFKFLFDKMKLKSYIPEKICFYVFIDWVYIYISSPQKKKKFFSKLISDCRKFWQKNTNNLRITWFPFLDLTFAWHLSCCVIVIMCT